MTPTAPACRPAPAEAAPERVATPIKSRTMPAAVIPAILPPTEKELHRLRDTRNSRRIQPVDRQRVGRSSHRAADNERKRCGSDITSDTHELLP